MARRRLLIVHVIALALVAAACGGGSGDSATSVTSAATATSATTGSQSTTAATTSATTDAVTTSAGTTPETTQATGGPRIVEIIADDEAFSVTEIAVAAGEEVTLVLNNKDTELGEPHNLRLTTPAETWFTDLADAPDVQEFTFTISEPGQYQFICDVHPDTMLGVVVVSP